jgi:SpoVK/Ycf46/Vps4 family AAA+-type ATPase
MTSDLFDEVIELPDPDMQGQFERLVGIDAVKELLLKEGRLLLNPALLDEWSQSQHGSTLPCVRMFQERPPLILFSGDVGTGKTTLANSFGDPIARSERIKVTVLRLSLMTRGRGAVGEMTQLISRAFAEVESLGGPGKHTGKKPGSAVILVIDEADALAESRATEQMHHEDRAGVNALIRGIDRLSQKRLPILVVLCTNRHEAMDPAVLRRAAVHHRFGRPDAEQRAALLRQSMGTALTDREFARLAEIMGPNNGRDYGYTYSDVTQRFVPGVVLEAFPHKPITFDLAMSVAKRIEPTKPFRSELRSDS